MTTKSISNVPFLTGKRRRRIQEAALAYLFLLPSILIIGVFGLFPLVFALYQSTLRGLNNIVGKYDGLGNYVRAMDNLAYVLAFWVAAALLFLAVRRVVSLQQNRRVSTLHTWIWLIPGSIMAAGIGLIFWFIFQILPAMLEIPGQMRGQQNTDEIFRQMMGEAWRLPAVQQSFWGAVGLLLTGLAVAVLVGRSRLGTPTGQAGLGGMISLVLLLAGCVGLEWLTWSEISTAYATATEAGEGLSIWSQIITISGGFLLLLLAWWLWESASHRTSNVSTALRLGGAALLMAGAWLLIAELPAAVASGNQDWYQGLRNTFFYVLGTVPLQLGISLILATLLFQNIQGKGFFRMVFFLPYIAPFVGTAAVFRILFSSRANAPINSIFSALGVNPLLWLNEPGGIFQRIAEGLPGSPQWLAGPSLALVVIMIYGIWSFVGFDTVIFLAGLGNIPRELYEVSAIDGAGRWAQFRHVTLPLLSPTIYFLTLYAVIGTFKAFNHIYVLRTAAALGTTDTASIVIFQAFKRDTRYGYASALAILLLVIIVIMTAVNNRIASRRVFYG